MTSEFIHLHNHSDYSLLDGAQRVDQLVNTIDDLNMDSLALTEHGNMFSRVPFYLKAEKAGIIELADIIVINKSDLPNADSAAISIKKSLDLSDKNNDTIVMQTSSIQQKGISDLIEKLDHMAINRERNILRIKERLLSRWDYKLLSNSSLGDILLDLESGAINLDEAIELL